MLIIITTLTLIEIFRVRKHNDLFDEKEDKIPNFIFYHSESNSHSNEKNIAKKSPTELWVSHRDYKPISNFKFFFIILLNIVLFGFTTFFIAGLGYAIVISLSLTLPTYYLLKKERDAYIVFLKSKK